MNLFLLRQPRLLNIQILELQTQDAQIPVGGHWEYLCFAMKDNTIIATIVDSEHWFSTKGDFCVHKGHLVMSEVSFFLPEGGMYSWLLVGTVREAAKYPTIQGQPLHQRLM